MNHIVRNCDLAGKGLPSGDWTPHLPESSKSQSTPTPMIAGMVH